MAGLKVFLSYHSSDKHLAGEIKLHLALFGLDVFLAHEDIEPAEEWQSRILSELKRSTVFLPLLTDNFMTSKWTAQECGIAVARGIFIISLKVTADPFGFLAKNQALAFRTENIARSCLGIARAINKNPKLHRRFLDSLIDSVKKSGSYEEAIKLSSLLNEFTGYNSRQVNDIIRGAIGNPQINKSFGAKRRIDTFIKKNVGRADRALLKAYTEKVAEVSLVKIPKP